MAQRRVGRKLLVTAPQSAERASAEANSAWLRGCKSVLTSLLDLETTLLKRSSPATVKKGSKADRHAQASHLTISTPTGMYDAFARLQRR